MASQGVQAGARDSSLHVATPLLRSEALSAALGREVLLKMECAQPSGSFKLRGIGATCKEVRLGAGGEGTLQRMGEVRIAWAVGPVCRHIARGDLCVGGRSVDRGPCSSVDRRRQRVDSSQ